jgi:transcriptional regulator with XRE-family HTH domain
MVVPQTCRAARALIDWSGKELAERSGIAERTLVDYERGASSPQERTRTAIQAALEAGGVTFFTFNGTIGVGIKRPVE